MDETKAKLERDYPGINAPTTERYYWARLSGREWRQILEADRLKADIFLKDLGMQRRD